MKNCHLCPFGEVKKHPTATLFDFRFCCIRMCWGQCPLYCCLSGFHREGAHCPWHTPPPIITQFTKFFFGRQSGGTTGNCILHNRGSPWVACGEEGNFHTRLIRGATGWRFWRAQWWYIRNSFTFGWGSCVLLSAPFRCISVFSPAPCECLAERHEITLPFKANTGDGWKLHFQT